MQGTGTGSRHLTRQDGELPENHRMIFRRQAGPRDGCSVRWPRWSDSSSLSALDAAALRRTGVKIGAVPPVTSYTQWLVVEAVYQPDAGSRFPEGPFTVA